MIDGQALSELIDRDPKAAWDRLVDDYSDLILGVIGRYTRDIDRQMDAYLYVLEELQAQDLRRLRHYEGAGRDCTFATWLKLVVRNLYFDWFRREHGRKSLPKEIQKLSAVEQRAFKLVYWEGYSAQEAFEILRGQVKGLRYSNFIQKLAGVEGRLSSINRAKIRRDIERARGPLSLDNNEDGPPLEARAAVRARTPEDETALAERRKALWGLIEGLPDEERLLIRLRFFEGLTAKQIAAAIGVAEPMQIYRRIERVCLELRRRAKEGGVDLVLLEGDPAELADTADLQPDPSKRQ
jgi:RNA polymerase sigma factor for flagellar operon FliA